MVNLPLNNVFLTGPLTPRVMDGLTEARSIRQPGFPSVSLQTAPGESPPLSRSLGVINQGVSVGPSHLTLPRPQTANICVRAQLRPRSPNLANC